MIIPILYGLKKSNRNENFKIAIIGESGCGKSTLINALLGKIVLPESPMTSTPVLTFIEYTDRKKDYAQIVGVNQKVVETLAVELFIKKYCFNVEEQGEVDRKRFLHISHAVLYVNSDFLKNGVQIIDTLGFSAADHDTETTKGVLSRDINLIFYVLSKNMLYDHEVETIQNFIGYRSDKQIAAGHDWITRKTSITKLYFLCNEKEKIIHTGLQNSICRIFHSSDCILSKTKIDNFAKNHILRCNFLVGRVLSCGIYPYSKYLSPLLPEEEAGLSVDMERSQRQYVNLDKEDEDLMQWENTRNAINQIIDTKKKDIESGKKSSVMDKLRGNLRRNILSYISFRGDLNGTKH